MLYKYTKLQDRMALPLCSQIKWFDWLAIQTSQSVQPD